MRIEILTDECMSSGKCVADHPDAFDFDDDETDIHDDFLSDLADLSEQQRACVVLRYVGQFKSGEIAEILDTSSATVSVQLGRAHTALRSRLTEPGGS